MAFHIMNETSHWKLIEDSDLSVYALNVSLQISSSLFGLLEIPITNLLKFAEAGSVKNYPTPPTKSKSVGPCKLSKYELFTCM